MYVMHLNSTCNQNKSEESIFVEQRDEKEVPTKSCGHGNEIFPVDVAFMTGTYWRDSKLFRNNHAPCGLEISLKIAWLCHSRDHNTC